MSEIFKLVAKLVLDTSGFDKSTEESKEKASVFADVLKADLVGRGISAAWDGLKKLGGAVKDFTADAVMSYGEIEHRSRYWHQSYGEQEPPAEHCKAY